MTRREPLATCVVVPTLAALGLAAAAAGPAPDAHARPAAGAIVVNRDAAIRPRRTATLAILCPRGYVVFAWGFRTINPNPSTRLNAIFRGAEPFLRRTGGASGYAMTFSNPNQTTTPARLSVTCVRPVGMSLRFQVGGRAAHVAGGGSRDASVAARRPGLDLRVVERRRQVAPGRVARIRQFCSDRRRPRRVPVSSSFTLGDARLAGNFPVARGGRFGWETEFANPTDRAQTVESRVVCAQGRGGMGVSVAGSGRARAAVRAMQLHVDARKAIRVAVPGDPFFFRGTCGKGLFSQWAYRALNRGDPGHVPVLGDWAHLATTGAHEAMSRFVGFDYDEFVSGLELVLQPVCVKGRRLGMDGRELILDFGN